MGERIRHLDQWYQPAVKTQQDPDSSGWINWPTKLRATGGNGLWVYAFWLAEYNEVDEALFPEGSPVSDMLGGPFFQTVRRDPFVKCHGPDTTIALPLANAVVSSTEPLVYPPERAVDHVASHVATNQQRERYLSYVYDAGASVLAAVCLGSTSHAYIDDEAGEHWACVMSDLTSRGRRLINMLDELYGRKGVFVTYLDS